MVLVKILKINWGLDFLWSKIYDKGMVKERQGKCVMILYHNSLCVLTCTGTQNRIKEQSMYYIGIDLGTSAVKLLLMEGNGKIVRVTSREYPLYFPHPGWSQQNPEDWYKQSMDGLCEQHTGQRTLRGTYIRRVIGECTDIISHCSRNIRKDISGQLHTIA